MHHKQGRIGRSLGPPGRSCISCVISSVHLSIYLLTLHPYMHTCVHPADYSPIHACIDLYRTPRTELGMRCLTLNKTILILALSKLRVL